MELESRSRSQLKGAWPNVRTEPIKVAAREKITQPQVSLAPSLELTNLGTNFFYG